MKKIIGIGNALVDILVQMKDDSLLTELQLPKGGMQLIDEQQQQNLHLCMKTLNPKRATGGCASNTMLALANLGMKPGFIGKIGRDETGSFFSETFRQLGIQTHLSLCNTSSGVANTFISANGERTFGTYLGAAALMQADEITPGMFHGYQLLHIEGYLVQNHELIEKICQTAKQEGLMLLKKSAQLPEQISDILKMTMSGQTKVNLDVTGSEEPLRHLDRMINKVILAVLVAALLLGSSTICTTQMTPKIMEIPLLGFLGYLIAFILSLRIIWEIHKGA